LGKGGADNRQYERVKTIEISDGGGGKHPTEKRFSSPIMPCLWPVGQDSKGKGRIRVGGGDGKKRKGKGQKRTVQVVHFRGPRVSGLRKGKSTLLD